MKEGYILYVVGKEEVKEEKLNSFLRSHNFDAFPCRLCGRRPLASMEQAYVELHRQGVDEINCLSVGYDGRVEEYFMLDQQMKVDGRTDLAQFCRPEELGYDLVVGV